MSGQGGSANPQASAASGGSEGWNLVETPAQPIRFMRITFDQAHRLAMTPRKKWDEPLALFVGASIAALPSAAQALFTAFHNTPFFLEDMEIFHVFFAGGLILVSLAIRFLRKTEQTSEEYLHELFQLARPKKRNWWSRKNPGQNQGAPT